MDDRGRTGLRAGANVDRRARDRPGRRHPADERHSDIRESLAHQLTVGIVVLAVGHPVGDLGRQQALERRERRDREDARHQRGKVAAGDAGPGRHRQPRRDMADPRSVQPRQLAKPGGDDDGRQRRGKPPVQPAHGDHHHRDEYDQAERRPSMSVPARHRPQRDRGGVGPVGLGHPERGRHLLQEDQQRDADPEALDDRPRQDPGVAAQAHATDDHQQDTGQQRDQRHATGPDRRHQRDQHDGHRARRTADLYV